MITLFNQAIQSLMFPHTLYSYFVTYLYQLKFNAIFHDVKYISLSKTLCYWGSLLTMEITSHDLNTIDFNPLVNFNVYVFFHSWRETHLSLICTVVMISKSIWTWNFLFSFFSKEILNNKTDFKPTSQLSHIYILWVDY